MSLKEQLVSDAALFLNEDEMAEPVTYEGSAITAIVDRGAMNRDGVDGNEIANDGTADRAIFYIAAEDVANPSRSHRITDEAGNTWKVMSIQASDGGMHALLCVTNEVPWG